MKQTGVDLIWAAPANTDLTLLCLEAIFESQVPLLAAATDKIASAYHPGKLEAKGLVYFGRVRSPEFIWADLTGNLQPLLARQAEILAIAKTVRIYTNAKPFQPHLAITVMPFY